MKKRYFLIALLVAGLSITGCQTSKSECLKDYDLIMLTKNMPDQNTSITWRNMHTEISECSFFTDICTLNSEFPYGTAYYINQQNTPITLQVT